MRIGLAGTGRIGARRQDPETIDGVDDLVLADLDTALAERVASDLGVGAAPSIEALLDSGLDGFVITAGTAAHAELIAAGIAAASRRSARSRSRSTSSTSAGRARGRTRYRCTSASSAASTPGTGRVPTRCVR